jgi:hypothetical protein
MSSQWWGVQVTEGRPQWWLPHLESFKLHLTVLWIGYHRKEHIHFSHSPSLYPHRNRVYLVSGGVFNLPKARAQRWLLPLPSLKPHLTVLWIWYHRKEHIHFSHSPSLYPHRNRVYLVSGGVFNLPKARAQRWLPHLQSFNPNLTVLWIGYHHKEHIQFSHSYTL